MLLYVLSIALVAASAPTLRSEVQQRLADSAARDKVTDPGLADLAVNIGVLVAVLVFMLVLALYLSLAATMDRHIFRPRLRVNGHSPFGLFFVVAACCTVPVHAVSTTLAIAAPKDTPLFFAYVIAVGLAAPWLFRRHWIDIPRSKKAIVFSSSVLLAAAAYVA